VPGGWRKTAGPPSADHKQSDALGRAARPPGDIRHRGEIVLLDAQDCRAGQDLQQLVQRRRNSVWEAARSAIELDQERAVSFRSHQRGVADLIVDLDREIVRAAAGAEESKGEGVVSHGFLCEQRARKRPIRLASFSAIRGEPLTENGGHFSASSPGQ